MTVFLGDRVEDSTVDFKWNSTAAAGGSITLATDGTISVYKGNNTTQTTAGVTFTEDFDGVTGVHHVRIDTSADAFYVTGEDYFIVLTGATIDGQTVNHVLAQFTIEKEFNEVDVTKFGGVAGTFSGGRPETNTTHWAGTAVGSANVLIDGAITNAKYAANAITASVLHSDVTTELQAGLATAANLQIVDDFVDDLEGRLTSTRAGNLDNLDAAISSRLAPTVAARTLDVTATGAAGIDWGNVENQSTIVNLSSTNIDDDQQVDVIAFGGEAGTFAGGIPNVNVYKWANAFANLSINLLPAVSVSEIQDGVIDAETFGTTTWDAIAKEATVDAVQSYLNTNLDVAVSTRLAPTVNGRTLDVTIGGGAGIDWSNVENQGSIVNLSSTNIDSDQVVASVSGAVGSISGVTFPTNFGTLGINASGHVSRVVVVDSVTDLADNAINEASVTTPAESGTRPTGWLGKLNWIFAGMFNERDRDITSGSGEVAIKATGGASTLITYTQSTVGNVDSISEAA